MANTLKDLTIIEDAVNGKDPKGDCEKERKDCPEQIDRSINWLKTVKDGVGIWKSKFYRKFSKFFKKFESASCKDKYKNKGFYKLTFGELDKLRKALIFAEIENNKDHGYKSLDHFFKYKKEEKKEQESKLTNLDKLQIMGKGARYLPTFYKYFHVCDTLEEMTALMETQE